MKKSLESILDSTTKAFTLVELLITATIIGILAAIAIPNLLEYQTRAKIAQIVSDQRVIATALESYNVDNGKYPLKDMDSPLITSPSYTGTYGTYFGRVIPLTTPIAYMGTVSPSIKRTTDYNTAAVLGYTDERLRPAWRLVIDHGTPFPTFFTGLDPVTIAPLKNIPFYVIDHIGPDKKFNVESPTTILPATPYDPTNGTVSEGDIFRSNQPLF